MNKGNFGKAKELLRKIESIDRELSQIVNLNRDAYIVSWTNRFGGEHRAIIPSEDILPVIKKHKENLEKEKFDLELELESLE